MDEFFLPSSFMDENCDTGWKKFFEKEIKHWILKFQYDGSLRINDW